MNAAGASAAGAAAPRGLTSIFGSNLATVTMSVPLNAQGQFPTSYMGTSVTVGGVAAPLLFLSPGQLNIQIPELAPGRHVVRVTGPAGASPDQELNVGEFAPGIFVITKADFSPVTASNPIDPNEPVILWTTGLGNSNPRVAPGVAAPADPIAIPRTPQVTFGGAPAEVLAVALSPGLVGVEQIVVRGVTSSGQAEVLVTTGGVRSNPAMLHVR